MRLLVLPVAVFISLLAAQVAQAHRASIEVNCEKATFNYSAFPSGQSIVNYVIKVDGGTYTDGSFSVTGPSASKTVPLSLTGNHTVYAKTTWTADGGGKAEATAELQCAPPPSPECPAGTSVYSEGPPLVCLKTETKTNTVTRTETVDRIVYVDKPVEVIVEKPVVVEKVVYKTKIKTKVKVKKVVKWRTKVKRVVKWMPCKKPRCKEGTTLIRVKGKYVCAIEGSG